MLVLLAILLLGTSRTGIATGLLALVLSVPLLIWPRASQPGKATASRRWAMAGAAALLGLALLAAGWEWAARFEAGRLLADGATRALLRQTTWQAALAHWPWGTGMGSYASAYMPWQPAELGFRWVATAHNDYLQMLMELGLGAVLLAAALLWLVGQRLWLVWHQRQPRGQAQSDASTTGSRQARQLQGLQTAAGLGVMTIALHATVDYPFYIPANAMMGCFLLGVWLRPWPAQAGVTSRTEGGT
ncbi:O-antigen ligase family protein [Hydrogenophaga sp.]|uniref:O-antigen ligase family protein n=1 Tax=Hydrogenophaga sp. TaxID=1904254 RepID=UPI0035B1ADE1